MRALIWNDVEYKELWVISSKLSEASHAYSLAGLVEVSVCFPEGLDGQMWCDVEVANAGKVGMHGAGSFWLVKLGNEENQGVFWSWERTEIQSVTEL